MFLETFKKALANLKATVGAIFVFIFTFPIHLLLLFSLVSFLAGFLPSIASPIMFILAILISFLLSLFLGIDTFRYVGDKIQGRRVEKIDKKTKPDLTFLVTGYYNGCKTLVNYFKLVKSKAKPSLENKELNQIISVLESYQPQEIIRDESELNKLIRDYLRTKLPARTIQSEYNLNKGNKVDIIIDSRIAVEVKIVKSNSILRNLVAQAEEYQPLVEHLIVYLYDTDQNVDLGYWKSKIESKRVKVIVSKIGRWKKRKQLYQLVKGSLGEER